MATVDTTLLYDLVWNKHKCYFVEFLPDVTCETTGQLTVRGINYDSLFDYYCQEQPDLPVSMDDPVVKVSFPGLDKPKPVSARRLRLRVMNEALPESLNKVAKISPAKRRKLIFDFWNMLRERPLGKWLPDLAKHFWYTRSEKTVLITPPALEFANEQRLAPPQDATVREYQKYYKQRRIFLNEFGCFHVPPAIERTIYFALPDNDSDEMMRERISKDITEHISKWAGKDFTHKVVTYSTIEEALTILRGKTQSGMVVFVFDDEDPATYFNLSYELKSWRIKRIIYSNLKGRFERLLEAEVKLANSDDEESIKKEIGKWRSFIEMNALDVMQQLDCVPWSIATPLNYEAHLAIDVGADRRYFALSLLICRDKQYKPTFLIRTIVKPKPDPKRETINEVILRDEIVNIFKDISRRPIDKIRSLLVLRDGRECGKEIDGIKNAQKSLISLGLLDESAPVEVVDFHKTDAKGIRIWDRNGYRVTNVLEGRALFLDDGKTVVLANTGAATLEFQCTADPCVLVVQDDNIDMLAVATDVFASCQFNFSNPRVAQRLPLEFKRTDEELKNRAAQEIRRIK